MSVSDSGKKGADRREECGCRLHLYHAVYHAVYFILSPLFVSNAVSKIIAVLIFLSLVTNKLSFSSYVHLLPEFL